MIMDCAKKTNKDMLKLCKSLQKRVEKLEKQQEETVAFSAYVTEGENLIAGRDKIVEFKGVLTNVGDAYDENSGLFTAPYAGVYFFILNVDVSTDHDCIRVRRNEKDVIFRADRDDESSTHLSGSASVILEEGDTISAHHCTGKGLVEEGKESTFAGFLIGLM
nr:hypothetical protein BaRGS_006861 [Batillaria attramentaria]